MTDRVVLVAGASSASGHAIAAALAATGATVVAVGSSLERLEGVEAHARFECDLADAAAVDTLVARVHEQVGNVDGLVHLVGGWRGGQSDEDFEWLERRILTTLRNTTRSFLDDLTRSTAGRLAIVSSTSVENPTWANANYGAVKAAAESWVLGLGSAWRKAGTAAAVIYVVKSLGESGTPVAQLADAIAQIWDQPAAELNGSRIHLSH